MLHKGFHISLPSLMDMHRKKLCSHYELPNLGYADAKLNFGCMHLTGSARMLSLCLYSLLVEPQLYPKQSPSLSRLLFRDSSSGVAERLPSEQKDPSLKKTSIFFQLRNLLQQCLQGCLITLWPNRIISFLS